MFASIHLVDPLYGVPTSGEGVAERGRVCVCVVQNLSLRLL